MGGCEKEVGRAMMQAGGYKREVPGVRGASEMLDPSGSGQLSTDSK